MSEKPQKKLKAKIGHSLEELEDGLILTLQDKPILQDGEINQEDDIFENLEKRQLNEQEHNRQLREKLKTIANAATSHIEAKNEGLKSLLPHYDDYRYKSDEVDLEDGSTIKRSRPKAVKNTTHDFELPASQNAKSEYYRRPVIKGRNTEKKKGNSSDLLAFLNETAVEKNDSGNNEIEKSAATIIQDSLNTIRKRRDLERQISHGGQNMLGSQQDELLAKAIERTRKKMEKERVNVLEMIKEEDEKEEKQKNYKQIQLKPVSYTSKKQQKNDGHFKITDLARGTTSCLFVNLPSEKLCKKEEEPIPQSFKDLTPEELEKMKQEIQFLQDQKLGIGLADTLKFLRQNNMLQKQEQFGRTNDEMADYNKPGDRVKLEYRNASGQLMKPKEAFRYMSAIFHGQGPGKNKIQKIKKKELMEMKIKEAANSQSKLMGLLEKHQSKTGEAHMVLEFGTKFKNQQ